MKSRPVILFDSFSNWNLSRSFGFLCMCVCLVLLVAVELYTRLCEATRMNQAPWCITWFKIRSRQSSAPFARLPITTQYRTHPSHRPLLRRSNYENRNPLRVFGISSVSPRRLIPFFFVWFLVLLSPRFPLVGYTVERVKIQKKKRITRLNVEIFRGTVSGFQPPYIT